MLWHVFSLLPPPFPGLIFTLFIQTAKKDADVNYKSNLIMAYLTPLWNDVI